MLRLAVLLVALWGVSASAQPVTDAPDGILLLDQERLFAQSLFGARVQDEIDAAGQALALENRAIEAELTAEELALTEARADLPLEEFRALAEDFDARVEAIRTEQDAKSRQLTAAIDAARLQFFDLAVPILLEIVRDRGAAVILDSRSVLLAADTVDITDEAILRVNEAIGRGPDAPLITLDLDD